MLFNSFEFLLVFLPIVLGGFFVLGRVAGLASALVWVIVCSLIFHGFTRASFTSIFVVSILVNYGFGALCGNDGPLPSKRARFWFLTAGICFNLGLLGYFNLGLLGYFKYAGFLASTYWHFTGHFIDVGDIALPLAISFYTVPADRLPGRSLQQPSSFVYVPPVRIISRVLSAPDRRSDRSA